MTAPRHLAPALAILAIASSPACAQTLRVQEEISLTLRATEPCPDKSAYPWLDSIARSDLPSRLDYSRIRPDGAPVGKVLSIDQGPLDQPAGTTPDADGTPIEIHTCLYLATIAYHEGS